MTKFQKQFILRCLDHISELLSDDERLGGAVLIFNQVQPTSAPESPHNIPNYFTNVQQWTSTDKIGLAAAILQATALTSYELSTNQDNFAEIGEATHLLLNEFIPLITINTQPTNRLDSVNQNIALTVLKIAKEPESQASFSKKEYFKATTATQEKKQDNNPYVFFSALAVSVTLASTVAFALTR